MSTLDVGTITSANNVAKAWCKFTGTGTPAIDADFGCASITDNGTGDYDVVWDTAFTTANYCITHMSDTGARSAPATATTDVQVQTRNTSFVLTDASSVYVAAFGDQ